MKLKIAGFLVVALISSAFSLVTPAPVKAAVCNITSVPSTVTVVPGGSFDVSIRIQTDLACRGVQFLVEWDPSLVQCTGADRGTFFNAASAQYGGTIFWQPGAPQIDNDTGVFPNNTTQAIALILGPGAPSGSGATGTGDCYVLHMQAKTGVSGTVTFLLSEVTMTDTSDPPTDLPAVISNGAVVVGNPEPPPITPGGWASVPNMPSGTLNGVWSYSNSDAYIVGENGSIVHFDGDVWNNMTSGITDTLEGVWAKSASEVYAVGRRPDNYGVILKYDGANWVSQISGVPYRFYDIWGSGSDVFAVGHNGWNGVVVHWDGTEWYPIYFSVYRPVEIWGTSATNVWVACEAGRMLHFDGDNWSNVTTGTTQDLAGIWGTSSSSLYAVGAQGTVLHYDGFTWSPMNSGTGHLLSGVWGTADNDVFAVGTTGTILHFDGNTWKAMVNNATSDLLDIMGLSTNDIYAVGSAGMVLRYYRSSPVISYFSPAKANTGETVNIYGSYFTGALAVSIGGVAQSNFEVVSDTRITVILGLGTSGNVSITTPLGTSIAAGFSFSSYDLNNDHVCNINDLVLVGQHFNEAGGLADINGDGTVSINDLVLVGSHFGERW